VHRNTCLLQAGRPRLVAYDMPHLVDVSLERALTLTREKRKTFPVRYLRAEDFFG